MKFPVCSLLALIASARGSQLVSGGGVRGQSRFLQGGGGDGGGGRGPPPDDGEDGGGGGGGGGFTTCSTNLAQISGVTRPSNGTCADFEVGVTYPYPEGFGDVLNEVAIYTCPVSDLRVIISNGIPDHDLTQNNPNPPCEMFYMVSVPLNPSLITNVTEPSPNGVIAMSLNGVPAFGAQEGGGSNAVEGNALPNSTELGGVPWYGHAARSGDWHYHSGEVGRYQTIDDVPSTELIGYALDGFPIYGPIADSSLLDGCNGIGDTSDTYRYHVRTKADIDETLGYCDGTSPSVNWRYTLGCYHGDLSMTVVEDSKTGTLPSDCVLETVETPTVAPTPSPVAVNTGPWSYTLPDWWDTISETHEGDDLKRCYKRQNPPTVGTTCAKRAKTCYWGDQPCGIDGSIPYPTTTCHCDGENGLRGTWSCEPVVCPSP